MKRNPVFFVLLLCFTLLQSGALAQTTNEAKTLLGQSAPLSVKDIGFFVAPTYGLTQLDGSSASLFNLRAGLGFKDKYTIGAYFNTSVNQVFPQSETLPDIYLDYWSVGGFAEYTLFAKRLAHLTFPVYLGYGEVQMDNERGEANLGEANFLQIEPSALLEINLHKYARFNVGVGYRLVGEMTYRNFNQSDISGITGYVGFKFGLFR